MTQVPDFGKRLWAQATFELERAGRSRTTHVLAAALLAVAALVAFGATQQAGAGPATGAGAAAAAAAADPGHTARLAFGGVAALRVFIVLLGVLCVTSEYHHGDIVWRCLAEPSRLVLMTAKAAACAVVGAVLGLAALQVGAFLTLVQSGGGLGLGGGEAARIVAGSVLGAALAGALGVGIGAALRNQTVAVVGTLVAVLVVEPVLSALVPALGDYLPSAAAAAAAGGAAGFGWFLGLVLFAGYAAAAVAAGSWLSAQRDV